MRFLLVKSISENDTRRFSKIIILANIRYSMQTCMSMKMRYLAAADYMGHEGKASQVGLFKTYLCQASPMVWSKTHTWRKKINHCELLHLEVHSTLRNVCAKILENYCDNTKSCTQCHQDPNQFEIFDEIRRLEFNNIGNIMCHFAGQSAQKKHTSKIGAASFRFGRSKDRDG